MSRAEAMFLPYLQDPVLHAGWTDRLGVLSVITISHIRPEES